MNPILSLINAEFTYPDQTHALKNISMDVFSGEKLAILGSNGSGKTTLFLLLNGVHKVNNGIFLFKGKKLNYSRKELFNLRKSVGIVFQDPDTQIFSASVRDEIAFGLLNLGVKTENIIKKTESIAKELHVHHLLDKPTHLLSYGEKRRVCIASILVMEPEILVLDEPTSGLDPLETSNFLKHLKEVNKRGKSIILSTHNVDLAYDWADRVIVLKEGMILYDSSPENLFRNNEIIKEAHLEIPFIEEIAAKLSIKLPEGKKLTKESLIQYIVKNKKNRK